jgi:hypothetical protein
MPKALRRRILVFSLVVAGVAAALVAIVSIVVSGLRAWADLTETNAKTLERIRCGETAETSIEGLRMRCDISALQNDLTFEPADYVLTREGYAFVWSQMNHPGFWANAADVEFVKPFRAPTSAVAVTGARWRLYSLTVTGGPKLFEVVVGYLEDANWLIEPTPANPRIDRLLREEAARIGAAALSPGGGIDVARINSKLDGWAVLDGRSGDPVVWNGHLPGRLPERRRAHGAIIWRWEKGRIVLVRQDWRGELLAVSLQTVADVWVVVTIVLGTFAVIAVASHWLCASKFRRHFLMLGRQRASLNEALKSGENARVEFKRDAGDRESLLRTITAFANSNDGTIFVGVADDGTVVGLNLTGLQDKDRFVTSLQNAVRDRIRPNPCVYVDFEEADGRTVARIFVPRGEQPLYCCDGRPYLRRGPQTVVGDGDEVARIVLDFA